MKKLLAILVLGLLLSGNSYAEIIELTKCYVNSYEDRRDTSHGWNYNDESWSEKSFKGFMKEHEMTIHRIIVDTERAYFSIIDGTQDDFSKTNYKFLSDHLLD